jgi:hypothetical protein
MPGQPELTVLFYFASDNPLAPLVISEIKAIKDAGFQEDTNVLVYFDPMEKGAPTQIYDVNSERKKKKRNSIGDGKDPFVRNMCEDEVRLDELSPVMQAALSGSGTVPASESLGNFIDFAITKRPAKNYMLFLIGHGMVVGNDAFLPDDDPVSAITLKQLKGVCEKFTNNGALQLLALHSCSMSSIEVAYQLKGLANYMLATQGTSFVNGWPYRQLLKKTLNRVKTVKDAARSEARANNQPEQQAADSASVNYPELIEKLYSLCLFNFTDFITAGYSCDLALCRLDPKELLSLKQPLQDLVSTLKKGLAPRVSTIKDLVLLAHWDAQSFWSENYTDLWDFCDCLARRCVDTAGGFEKDSAAAKELTDLAVLCDNVKKTLVGGDPQKETEGLVLRAENFGSEFQFARGLSIYFPWCEPLDDERAVPDSRQDDTQSTKREASSRKVLENYGQYDFTTDFNPNSWLSFLETYFTETKRDPRNGEEGGQFFDELTTSLGLSRDDAVEIFRKAETTFTNGVLKRTPELKKTPEVGTECTCPSIKNYPTKPIGSSRIKRFAITTGSLQAFLPSNVDEGDDPENEE